MHLMQTTWKVYELNTEYLMQKCSSGRLKLPFTSMYEQTTVTVQFFLQKQITQVSLFKYRAH